MTAAHDTPADDPLVELIRSTPLPGEGRDAVRRRGFPSDQWHRDLAQLINLVRTVVHDAHGQPAMSPYHVRKRERYRSDQTRKRAA